MNNNKVYIGNLSWQATEQDIKDLFAATGTVTEAKIVMDRETNRSKGFAFVTFENDEQATKAIQNFDQSDFMGRPLKVSIAENKPKDSRGPRPGGDRRHESFSNHPQRTNREY